MRNLVVILLLLLQGVAGFGQGLRIRNFRTVSDGAASDLRTGVTDPDGDPCAVLKIETGLEGLTFEAGLAGIMDVRYGNAVIYLYVPRSARTLTVAHKEYGALRSWAFPVSLEAGRTYAMSLSYEKPAPKPAPKPEPKPAPAPQPAPNPAPAPGPTPAPRTETVRTRPSLFPDFDFDSYRDNEFCNYFFDLYAGFSRCNDEGRYNLDWFGLSYTLMDEKVGPYLTVGMNLDESFCFLGGAAYRLTRPEVSDIDWQIYGGIGFFEGRFGGEIGTRFAWKSSSTDISLWDFGIGCQFYAGNVMPTISVGLCIWGVPALIGLGVVCCAVAGI